LDWWDFNAFEYACVFGTRLVANKISIISAFDSLSPLLLGIIRKQEVNKSTYTSFQFRLLNELPILFLVAIVLLAVVKDFLNFVFLLLGVLVFSFTLFFAAKAYKKFRERQKHS
jgi:hypothetical protein